MDTEQIGIQLTQVSELISVAICLHSLLSTSSQNIPAVLSSVMRGLGLSESAVGLGLYLQAEARVMAGLHSLPVLLLQFHYFLMAENNSIVCINGLSLIYSL